jgi:hypothetical protein
LLIDTFSSRASLRGLFVFLRPQSGHFQEKFHATERQFLPQRLLTRLLLLALLVFVDRRLCKPISLWACVLRFAVLRPFSGHF